MVDETTKTHRILNLLLLLNGTRSYSIAELTSRLGVSSRTVFRDISELRSRGFVIEQTNKRYRIDMHRTPGNLRAAVAGTGDAAEGSAGHSEAEQNTVYHLTVKLSGAIQDGKVIRLLDYESSRGRTFPRDLEPFLLWQKEQSLWAFDLSKMAVRQFKLMRMGDIELLDTDWQYSHKHKLPFTDIFNMSAPEPIDNIKLKLNQMAHHLLLEERPDSRQYEDPGEKGVFTIPVADYRAAGRFVLGLMDGIEVLGSEGFKEYLRRVVREHGRFA